MIYKCHVNSLKISPVNIPKKNYYFDMEILSQNNILINIHFLKKLALVLSFSESVLTYCQAHTLLILFSQQEISQQTEVLTHTVGTKGEAYMKNFAIGYGEG